MGELLSTCGDRDNDVGDVARALKGAFTSEAAEDDAADELSSFSRGSTRSKKFGRYYTMQIQSPRKLSMGSSFVGDVLWQKNRMDLVQKNKQLKKQLKQMKKTKDPKAKKATTAEMA